MNHVQENEDMKALGQQIKNHFVAFLNSFVLKPDNLNYNTYLNDYNEIEELPGLPPNGELPVYKMLVYKMRQDEKYTLNIDFDHLSMFQTEEFDIQEHLLLSYQVHYPNLLQGMIEFIQRIDGDFGSRQNPFQLAFFNLQTSQKLRDLKPSFIGQLTSFSGTVTRTTEVKPELTVGTFRCLSCNTKNANISQQFKYTTPVKCVGKDCLATGYSNFELVYKESTFMDWQKLRVQEHSSDIPAGSMPRSIEVVLRGETVDLAKPGDKSIFTGTLVAVPDVVQLLKPGTRSQAANGDQARARRPDNKTQDGITGLKQLGVRDLSYKLVFIANSVHSQDTRFGVQNSDQAADQDGEEAQKNFTLEEQHIIQRIKNTPDLYNKLSKSLAPAVFGHEDVKKGILLQLFGGVHKTTVKDGIKLRGDINICIVGDPATAKSQFLKYIHSFLPRCVYTSGKASSAAGLTASVQRDPETGEFCIEAGALMLADHGICCIDEFDKMNPGDQVAIHEAMEQQTITLAKAGIHATLNARASILAAANPMMGRYDRARSLRSNVNISSPIMSRFDLFFLVFDERRDDHDFAIANHIVQMHRQNVQAIDQEFSTEEMQTYIKFCRSIKPTFTKASAEILKNQYKRLRKLDAGSTRSSYKVTVRQLESMVRLSEAIARVDGEEVIKEKHVKEVCRLLATSNVQIVKGDVFCDDNPVAEREDRQLPQNIAAPERQPEAQSTKVKLSYDEYEKLVFMILKVFKDLEEKGEEQIQQKRITNQVVQDIEINEKDETNQEQAEQTMRKVNVVINQLIQKEGVLLVDRDAQVKMDRYLSVDVNVNLNDMNLKSGTAGGVYAGEQQ